LQSKFLAATGCLAGALALGVTACGGSDNGGSSSSSSGGGGKTVAVYSSVPLQGAARTQSEAIVNGAKLALEQAAGKAGSVTIQYHSLDDSTAQAGSWTAEAESANARKASQDKSTVAYLGTLNSGAAKVSIPLLDEAGIAMVSPANTYLGLTKGGPGAEPGEPDKYYPSGKRNYVRIVPKDDVQGPALVTLMKQDGCTKVAMTNDKETYGGGLAKVIATNAQQQGVNIISNDGIDKNAPNYRSLAQKAKAAGADCFLFSGIINNNAVQIYKDFGAALPTAKMYGPDGVAQASFVDPKQGGVPKSLDPRLTLTVATLSPDSYPAAGQEFFKTYSKKYGTTTVDPYALYGYEAMSLIVDAIKRSKTGDKADVIKALFETKDRASVLGTYSIDQNGDTTLTDYGAYKVVDGEMKFDQTVKSTGA